MKLFSRGDADGFFAIALDNLVQLILIQALCVGAVGMAPSFVFGRILPGVAVSYLAGNVFYAWQAHRLARRESRTDVCAMPFGLNVPTMVAYVFLVMVPARQIALARGSADPDGEAWRAGLLACVCSGAIELAGSFVAARLRRFAPRAAMLASLSGAGLAFLALNFLFNTFAHPLVGLVTLGLVMLFYFGRVKPRGGIPPALVVVAVGTACAWATGLAPGAPVPPGAVGWHPPGFVGAALWHGLGDGRFLPYLSVVIPMGLLNVLFSIQCLESAAAAGDAYSPRSSLIANAVSTLVAACFGSPFPTSLYIGHPAWKRMGARAAYSTLNGIFITGICLAGLVAPIAWAVPADAGLAIIIWVGLVIAVQAFEAAPRRQWPAVLLGMAPILLAWVAFSIKNALRIAGIGTLPGTAFSPELLHAFHASGVPIEGGFAVEQGAFFAALVLSAATVRIVERKFVAAGCWMFGGAALSLLGLMHSWRFAGADTVASVPILDRLLGAGRGGPLFPAAAYAAAYAAIGVALFLARWFTAPDGPPED